jgi:hypothetical protein
VTQEEIVAVVWKVIPRRKHGKARRYVDEFDVRDACPQLSNGDVSLALEILESTGYVRSNDNGYWRPLRTRPSR